MHKLHSRRQHSHSPSCACSAAIRLAQRQWPLNFPLDSPRSLVAR
jgi:hypothetical protein